MDKGSLLGALIPPPRFASDTEERAFRRRFLVTGLKLSRVACLIGGALALAFWILIGFVIDNGVLWNSRQWLRLFVAVALFSSGTVLYVYPRFALKNYTFVVGFPAVTVCFAIGLMSTLPPDVEHQTTTRLATAITVACWLMYGFARLPTRLMFSACGLASLLMVFGAVHYDDEYLFALLLYLTVANVVGWAMSIAGERRERVLFATRKRLVDLTRRLAASASANAEANALKTRVLAATSHDLRQPLASMALYVEALESSSEHGESSREAGALRNLKSCLAVMSNSVERLSNVASLQTGAVNISVEAVDLRVLLERLYMVFKGQADRIKVHLSVDLPSEGRFLIETNEDRLWDVLANLVSNGMKYAEPKRKSWVAVRAVSIGEAVRISVVDNGIGINQELHSRVFDEYFQIGNPERNRDKGYGLGLSIVRETLMRLPGHRLLFRSAIGRGSRFDVYVPRKEFRALRRTVSERIGDASAASLRSGVSGNYLNGCYALVVEDDTLVRSALVETMEGWGMLVEAAGSADEAIVLVKGAERLFDVVVSDFGLPGGTDGVGLIEAVRVEQGQRTPAIILSGQVASIDSSRLRQIGVRAMSKPVDHRSLRNQLVACVSPIN